MWIQYLEAPPTRPAGQQARSHTLSSSLNAGRGAGWIGSELQDLSFFSPPFPLLARGRIEIIRVAPTTTLPEEQEWWWW